jgi:hypothetical protein
MNRLLVVLSVAMAAFSFQASAAKLNWGTITQSPIQGHLVSGQVTDQDLFGSVIKIAKGASVSDTWNFNLSAASLASINISSLKVNPTWLASVTLDKLSLTQNGGVTNGAWSFDGNLSAGLHTFSLVGKANGTNSGYQINVDTPALVAQTPIPAAIWLFGSALMGLTGVSRRKKA